jgi:hypothetical protein
LSDRAVLIYAPAYHNTSAGVRACHLLCHELRLRGVKAAMRITHGDWRPSPYDAPPVQVLNRYEIDDSVCVFPEYITHTTVKAPRAVKWWLQKPQHKLNIKGLTYVWSKAMGNHPRLMLDVIDLKLFYPKTGHGGGVAYYVGKGVKDEKLIPKGAVEITRETPPTRGDLANLLRAIDHLICFDGYTALATEAAMCGTPVLFANVPKELRKLNAAHEFGDDGFAYSMPELESKRANVLAMRARYEQLVPTFQDDIDYFVATLASKW